jgi:ribosomal protein S18 acetylase RimI-like enzyme
MNFDKLDNSAWYSLSETHSSFAIGDDEIRFYQPHICSFGGINSKHADLISFLKKYTELDSFYIIGEKPQSSPEFIIEKELVCLQMICSASIKIEYTESFVHLNNTYEKELFELVNLVQPGYFEENTSLMGDYFGIFQNDKLVAVTGERMKMFGFTEISAVVTHPDFTSKGFAKQLVAYTANMNFEKNIAPYLHVAETNINAIKLYEKLGFVTRRKISFWKMKE